MDHFTFSMKTCKSNISKNTLKIHLKARNLCKSLSIWLYFKGGEIISVLCNWCSFYIPVIIYFLYFLLLGKIDEPIAYRGSDIRVTRFVSSSHTLGQVDLLMLHPLFFKLFFIVSEPQNQKLV